MALAGLLVAHPSGSAQSCVTQAKMSLPQRTQIGAAAFHLATAVLHGNTAEVQRDTIAAYATNFGPTASLIEGTAGKLSGDSLLVSQVYLLDASSRSASETTDAEFSCPLTGAAAETDFSIGGLPPGRYAFAMVEAAGPNPWLLSFLLQTDPGGGWKMAGFYPHRRNAAGHNGLWYWTSARAEEKAGKPWLAWVLYGQADELLRPANFISSTNLDRLRTETRAAAPPAIASGLSDTTPLVLRGPGGLDFRITGLNSQSSDDGKQLNLIVHLRAATPPSAPAGDPNAVGARNLAAGTALLAAYPELRSGFDNLWVIAEAPNTNAFVTERPMAEIPGPK